MKNIVLALLLLVGMVGTAQALPACATGTWYNPAAPGEGLLLNVAQNGVGSVFGAMFTHEYAYPIANPGTGPTLNAYFYTVQGDNVDGETRLLAYETRAYSGPLDPLDARTTTLGLVKLLMVDDNHLRFQYNLGYSVWPGCDIGPFPSYCVGEVLLSRLVDAPVLCEGQQP